MHRAVRRQRSADQHRHSVLATPNDTDHGNIRNLMTHGLAGVSFAGQPLAPKS
ncbi:HopJ type III effector protein [Streptomyces sp. NBC_00207]|uniref:HopJ type III effector protein n=1 Tax=Streptomyces sp. NBC_00207 TaxID=2903635 RepID=UPI003254D9B7